MHLAPFVVAEWASGENFWEAQNCHCFGALNLEIFLQMLDNSAEQHCFNLSMLWIFIINNRFIRYIYFCINKYQFIYLLFLPW